MTTLDKFVQATDMICGCLPVVSTLTNGAQLIYRLAHRVDAVANPVAPGLKTAIKIHVLNKEIFDLLIGLIPIVGNLYHLVGFILKGFVDQLLLALNHNNTEVVRLCLSNNHLNDNANAGNILSQAANSLSEQNFGLILDARPNWSKEDLAEGLRGCWDPKNEPSHAANATMILNYFIKNFPGQTFTTEHLEDAEDPLSSILERFIEANQSNIVKQILYLFPACDFQQFDKILRYHSFNSYQSFSNAILNKCKSCSFDYFIEFLQRISYQRNALSYKLHTGEIRDETLEEFDQLQSDFTRHLVEKLPDEVSPPKLIKEVERLFRQVQKESLVLLLNKFKDKISPENKLELLKTLNITYIDDGTNFRQQESEFFEFVLRLWKDSLSNEQILDLRDCLVKEKNRSAALEFQQGAPYPAPPFNKISVFIKVFPELAPAEEGLT